MNKPLAVVGRIVETAEIPGADFIRQVLADGAVAALNAAYWSKALSLTDVLDCMPQKRRIYCLK